MHSIIGQAGCNRRDSIDGYGWVGEMKAEGTVVQHLLTKSDNDLQKCLSREVAH